MKNSTLWIMGEMLLSTIFALALFVFEVFDKRESRQSVMSGLRDRFYLIITTPKARAKERHYVSGHERFGRTYYGGRRHP